MFKKLIFVLALLTISIAGHGQNTRLTQAQQFPNLLDGLNPGFENGGAKWIASPTSTFSLESSDVGRGKKSAIFNAANSGEFLRSPFATIPKDHDGKDCIVRASLDDGDATNLKFQIYDGTVVRSETVIPALAKYTDIQLSFTCVAGDTIAMRIISTAAATAIKADSVYIGRNFNVGSGEKPDWYLDASMGGSNPALGAGAATVYSVISSGSLDIITNPASTVVAKAPCSGSNPPTGATCDVGTEHIGVAWDLPEAGTVEVCASFAHLLSLSGGIGVSAHTTFQLVEVSTTDAGTIIQEGGSRVEHNDANGNTSGQTEVKAYPNLCGTFVFDSIGTKVIKLMFEQDGAIITSSIQADREANGRGQRDIHFTAKPVSQKRQTAIIPSIHSWNLEVDIGGGNPDLASTSSNYQQVFLSSWDMVVHKATPGLNPKIGCDGGNAAGGGAGDLTCSSGAENAGVAFDIPAKQRIRACVSFTHRLRSSNGTASHRIYWKLVVTGQSSATIDIDGINVQGHGRNPTGAIGFVNEVVTPVSFCQEFDIPQAGPIEVQLFNEVLQTGAAIETNMIRADRSNSEGNRTIHFQIYPVNESVSLPVLIDFPEVPVQPAPSFTGQLRIVSAEIEGTGTPAVIRQDGDWIDSVFDTSTGRWKLFLQAGTFASPPICIAGLSGPTINHIMSVDTILTDSIEIQRSNLSSTLIDGRFSIICFGTK